MGSTMDKVTPDGFNVDHTVSGREHSDPAPSVSATGVTEHKDALPDEILVNGDEVVKLLEYVSVLHDLSKRKKGLFASLSVQDKVNVVLAAVKSGVAKPLTIDYCKMYNALKHKHQVADHRIYPRFEKLSLASKQHVVLTYMDSILKAYLNK